MTSDTGRKQLAFCITDLDSGGAERALVKLVTGLDRTHWSPAVYCLSRTGALVAELEERGVPVTCLGARNARSLLVLPRLVSLLRKQRPALLQTFLYHANILGRVAGRLAGVRHVVSGVRVAEKRSRFRLWLDRATDRWVERHVCVSHAVAQFCVGPGRLPAHKVVVIPNGVDADLFRLATPADLSEFGIPADAHTLLFVGRLDHQKGPNDLWTAFGILAQRRNDVQLLIVGEGPLRSELKRRINESDLRDRVHLIGRRDDVPRLMRAADCLVLPSRWEGMPNVVLEAMAAGLPVVATRVEGTTELLEEGGESGERGLLVSPSDPQSLAEEIETALSGSSAIAAMKERAQQYVRKSFTWDDHRTEYEQLYAELIFE